MKALITGSRNWSDQMLIHTAIVAAGATEIAQGGASGADGLAQRVAADLQLPCKTYPADWDRFGVRAGPIRNAEMLDDYKPDVVLAFWDGFSTGTRHMTELAKRKGYRVILYTQHRHTVSRREFATVSGPLFREA